MGNGIGEQSIPSRGDERWPLLKATNTLHTDDLWALLGTVAQAVWETNAVGQVVSDSPSWRAYTGQSVEQWLGEGWVAAVHPDDRAYALSQWQQAVKAQQPVDAEFRLRSPDGGWRWTNVRAKAMLHPDGSIRKWVGMNTDITDRKRAEESLHQQQETFRIRLEQQVAQRTTELEASRQLMKATLDSSLDLIQVFEAVRSQQGDIVDFIWSVNNRTAEQVHGNVVGKSLLTLNPGVVEEGIFDTFKEVVQAGTPAIAERHYVHEQFNGWFQQSVVKLGDGVVTTTADITDRKQAEQQLIQSEAFLQSIIDSSLDVIQVFLAVRDPNDQIIDFSWKVNNHRGVEQNGDVIGKSLLAHNRGVIEAGIFERMVTVTQTGVAQQLEQYYTAEQFNDQWFYLTLVKQGDGLIMTTREITAQKKAELEVLRLKDELARHASYRYSVLFNSIDQGFCTIEVKYDQTDEPIDYQFLEVSPSFEHHTGIKDGAGRWMREIAADQEAFWFETYGRIAKDRTAERFESCSTPLGRWWSVYAFPIDEPGLRRIGVLFYDITARKQQEEGQAYLLKLSDELRPLTDPVVIQATAARLLDEHLGTNQHAPRPWTPTDVSLVEETAERTWAAVERAKAEETLRQSEEKFRTLFASIDEGFHISELIYEETGQVIDWRFLEVNQVFEDQTGLHNATGRLGSEIAPDTEAYWLETYAQVVKTGESIRLENYNEFTRRWYSAYASRVGGAGSRQFAVVFNDITERKRHEANLAFLADVGQDLASLMNIDETMNALGAKIGGHFKVADVIFSEVSDDEQTVHVNHEWHRADFPAMKGHYAVKAYFSPEFERLHRAGQIAIVRDTANDQRVDAAAYAQLGVGTLVNIPLIRQNKWRFNFTLLDAKPRDWRADEIELVRELITRIWARLERARGEEALAESEEKFRTLFEKMGEGFALCEGIRNETGKLVDYRHKLLNPAYERLTGLKREDALRKRALEIAPSMEDWWFEAFQKVLDTGETIHFEQYFAHFARWYEVTAFRYTNETFAYLYNDITERRQSQQHQAFLLKFSDTIRTQPNADAIANCALQVLGEHLQLDRCYIGVYRLAEDRGEFTHQVGNDRVPPVPDGVRLSDFPDALRVAFDRTLVIDDVGKTAELTDVDRQNLGALGFSALVGSTLRHGERNPLWSIVAISARPRRWTPDEIKLIEEVTERTWTAIERVKAEEALRVADQRKDEFLAMLAHELRNPMATVRNGLNILSLMGSTDEMTGQTVGMMNRQVDHLVRLVDDLLDVSRISRNKIELKYERAELGALVAGAVEAIRPQFTAMGKELHLTPSPVPLVVWGDTTRLSQVVTNLLTNGLRYTGRQGQVWVSIAREAGGEAILRVSDNGIGLSADQLPAIFELFVQADHSVARQQGGLGIGLTLVRRLVNMHGGRVEARSPGLGAGSEFVVYLPLLEADSNETMTTDNMSMSGLGRHRILVIDDNADAALTLSMMLKLKGFEVHTRHSGRDGLQAGEVLRPSVILCDIGMPELDGYQTARLFRQQPWGTAVMLIALTGYGQEEDKRRAKEAGFDDHMIKPVDLAALVRLLEELP